MKLYLVRHADPDYERNIITEKGQLQAETVSSVLAALKPDAIYSSPFGRAMLTAEPTAKKLGMQVIPLDFMHEIATKIPKDDPEKLRRCGPWYAGDCVLSAGGDLVGLSMDTFEAWNETNMPNSYREVCDGFDAFMKGLGYDWDGRQYHVQRESDRKLMIFAHGGSISCLLSHLLGLNVYYVCTYFRIDCTGITEINFEALPDGVVIPRIESFNNHMYLLALDQTSAGLPQSE